MGEGEGEREREGEGRGGEGKGGDEERMVCARTTTLLAHRSRMQNLVVLVRTKQARLAIATRFKGPHKGRGPKLWRD